MKQSLSFQPIVHAKMMAHASKNPRSVVHGILLGNFDSNQANVVDVLPVCHSTPTKPILDMSLRLAEAYCISSDEKTKIEIIGWYTAPEKDIDDSPGPVALKIISSIAASSESSENDNEHILVCITNKDMEKFFKVKKDSDHEHMGFTVYACNSDGEGKWNNQYSEESIKSSIVSWSSSNKAAVQVCLDDDLQFFDFEDHLSSGTDDIKQTDWIKNKSFGDSLNRTLSQQKK